MPTNALPTPKAWGLFALLLLLDTAAQLLFKVGVTTNGEFPVDSWQNITSHLLSMMSNFHLLAGIGCLLVAFLLWLAIISTIDLSEAHPISCIVYGTVAIASCVILGETFTWHQTLGVTFIIAGAFVTSEP